MTKEEIFNLEKPEWCPQEEWEESQLFVWRNSVLGVSASIAASLYENVEAIKYIRAQLTK